jgi:hypothetical protein
MVKNYRRIIRRSLPGIGLLTGMLSVVTARGHHSVSAYDLDREERITATVIAFDWLNPHTRAVVEPVDAPGRTVSFEGMSPDFLGRRSWNRLTLKPGDKIEITYFPLRDGAPGGLLVRVRLPDGTVRVMVDND